MSTAEHDSSLHIVLPPMDPRTPSGEAAAPPRVAKQPSSDALVAAHAEAASAGLWLNGDVLACACPECHGPMSIRLWLLVADCWMCGTSIELTEQQERAALKLLEARQKEPAGPAPKQAPAAPRSAPEGAHAPVAGAATAAAPAARPPAAMPATAPAKPSTIIRPRPSPPQPAPSASPQQSTQRQKLLSPTPPTQATAPQLARPLGPAAMGAIARRKAHDWLRDLPAWLVSLIFHIVAMLLLGLLTVSTDDPRRREILLTATMGKPGIEGGEKKKDEHIDAVVIEDPGPEQAPEPAPTKEEIPPPPPPEQPPEPQPPQRDVVTSIEEMNSRDLPTFERVREALAAPAAQRMFEGRDPRVRTQLVMAEGGSMYTEAAVAQGLRWLARHQADDGRWSLHEFDEHGDCNGRCEGSGIGRSDVGATGLALLPFLGAGQTHTRGMYKVTVRTGLEWLLAQQERSGDLRGEGIGRMYAHGIATIVLCEAYALTGDEALKDPAQRAINWIVRAQHHRSGRNTGGWRYDPGQQGDTSVVGWQLMALRSGRMAGLKVPSNPFVQAGKFLDYVQHGHYGGLYSYQRGRNPEPAMTAEGLLCRQYLGWPESHRGLKEGVEHLLDEHLPDKNAPNIYYWYYGTQVMHHIGGEAWERWNNATREALIELQDRHGHQQGSWPPEGGAHAGYDVTVGGRLYVTALAVCTLEVYYRHLPLYRSIEIESEE